MLSKATQEKLFKILKRMADGDPISLNERVYVQNIANESDQASSLLKRAHRIQQDDGMSDEIDKLMHSLDLGFSDPQSAFNPKIENIEDWFMGAPKWLGRS